MDKKGLEEYEANEWAGCIKLLKDVKSGLFHVGQDKFPPDNRYPKLQTPSARIGFGRTSILNGIYPQIPFCGSLIIEIPPYPKRTYEAEFAPISEIPKLVEFAKDTGKIQFEIVSPPTHYADLNFLDPILEMKPPWSCQIPTEYFISERDLKKVSAGFTSLGNLGFFNWFRHQPISSNLGENGVLKAILNMRDTYLFLKINNNPLAEEIENQLVDNYSTAFELLIISRAFITDRMRDNRRDIVNFSLEDLQLQNRISIGHNALTPKFPCEIGSFLMTKLTYAPPNLEACKELMYHYNAYDLRKVQQSLNEAIIDMKPELLNESKNALSEILDNIWADKTIERKIQGIQAGIPLSMAVIGSLAAGPIGAAGGLLAGLGYSVLDKTIDLGTSGFSEKAAKLSSKSYQVNIFDFKKKVAIH
jgi:hypothetical protein